MEEKEEPAWVVPGGLRKTDVECADVRDLPGNVPQLVSAVKHTLRAKPSADSMALSS